MLFKLGANTGDGYVKCVPIPRDGFVICVPTPRGGAH